MRWALVLLSELALILVVVGPALIVPPIRRAIGRAAHGPPPQPDPGASRPDVLEPPAVASVLALGGRVTAAAVDATVLDLADRGIVEVYWSPDSPFVTHLRVVQPSPAGLLRYEHLILTRLIAVAGSTLTPVAALPFAHHRPAAHWQGKLNDLIRAETQNLGLTDGSLAEWLGNVAAAFVPLILTLGVLTVPWPSAVPEVVVQAALLAGLVTTAMLVSLALPLGVAPFMWRQRLPEHLTPAGRAAASRWLGVRERLRGSVGAEPSPLFVLPGRQGVDATALGSVPARDLFDMDGMTPRRFWSVYTGTWRELGTRELPGPTRLRRLLWLVGLSLLFFGAFQVVTYFVGEQWSTGGVPADLIGGVGAVLAAFGARHVIDHAAPVTVTGELVSLKVNWLIFHSYRSTKTYWFYQLAVDDGRGKRIKPFWTRSNVTGEYGEGDVVAVKAGRISRAVRSVVVQRPAAAGRPLIPTSVAGGGLVAAAAKPIPELITPAEVAAVLGGPVSVSHSPVSFVEGRKTAYVPPGTSLALEMLVCRGTDSANLLGIFRNRTPLPNIGDEAYLTTSMAVARCGDTAVRIIDATRRAGEAQLIWMLSTAIARLKGS